MEHFLSHPLVAQQSEQAEDARFFPVQDLIEVFVWLGMLIYMLYFVRRRSRGSDAREDPGVLGTSDNRPITRNDSDNHDRRPITRNDGSAGGAMGGASDDDDITTSEASADSNAASPSNLDRSHSLELEHRDTGSTSIFDKIISRLL